MTTKKKLLCVALALVTAAALSTRFGAAAGRAPKNSEGAGKRTNTSHSLAIGTQVPAGIPLFSGAITAGDCAAWSSSGVLADAGSACGSSSSATAIQVNGAATTSQSPMNFQSGGYITVTNPSAGNIQFNFTGPLGVDNGGTGLTSAGASGQCLTSTGAALAWSNCAASVGLSAPAIFSVSGSPVTASGTIALGLANENANLVFAGPSSGAAATPTFRALTAADIPALNYQAPLSSYAAPGNEFLTGFTAPGTFTATQPSFANLSGTATLVQLPSTLAQFSGTITANDCAKWSASGVLVDAGSACSAGSGSTGGANTDVQFNNSGAFGGSANFTFNSTTGIVTAQGFQTAGGSAAGCLTLNELPSNGTTDVQLCAPASIPASTSWTLPAADGTSGQVLSTNGSGVLSWTTPSASAGSSAWSAITNPTGNVILTMGSNASTFDSSLAIPAFTWQQSTAATSSANYNSPQLQLGATYWNGSASANNSVTLGVTEGTGANPETDLTIGSSGSTGPFALQLPGSPYIMAPSGGLSLVSSAQLAFTIPAYSYYTFLANVGDGIRIGENAAPSGLGGYEVIYGDSTAHALELSNNNGSFAPIAQTVTANVPNRNSALASTNLMASAYAGVANVSLYAYDSTAGMGCTGNTTVTWTIGYTDPAGAVETQTATETITGNGGAAGGDKLTQLLVIDSKAGTAITFSTAYTEGTGCTTAPGYAADLRAAF